MNKLNAFLIKNQHLWKSCTFLLIQIDPNFSVVNVFYLKTKLMVANLNAD